MDSSFKTRIKHRILWSKRYDFYSVKEKKVREQSIKKQTKS